MPHRAGSRDDGVQGSQKDVGRHAEKACRLPYGHTISQVAALCRKVKRLTLPLSPGSPTALLKPFLTGATGLPLRRPAFEREFAAVSILPPRNSSRQSMRAFKSSNSCGPRRRRQGRSTTRRHNRSPRCRAGDFRIDTFWPYSLFRACSTCLGGFVSVGPATHPVAICLLPSLMIQTAWATSFLPLCRARRLNR